jgi:hypothetical protein
LIYIIVIYKDLNTTKEHEKRCNDSTTNCPRLRKKIREYGADALEKKLCTKDCGPAAAHTQPSTYLIVVID